MALLQQNRDRKVGTNAGHMFERPVSEILELDRHEKKRLEIYNRTGRHAHQNISGGMDRNLFDGSSKIDRGMIGMQPESPKNVLEQEKRMRREIANSNERRRMQGINAGIQVLLQLLPDRGGEKLSKAAILQNAAELVNKLEKERSHLMELNRQLCKKMAGSLDILNQPSPKKRRRETSTDSSTGDPNFNAKQELMELRRQLQQERANRMQLEEKIWILESHLRQLDIKSNTGNHSEARENSTEPSVKVLHQDHMLCSSETNLIHNGEMDLSFTSVSHGIPISESAQDLSNSSAHQHVVELSPPDAETVLFLDTPCSSPFSSHHVSYDFNSASKQNLESIVEAIKLVEGPHIFGNTKSSENQGHYPQGVCSASRDTFMIHQVIPKPPSIQTRPGVIVANPS